MRTDDILGLFNFKDDVTRRVSGWLDWPLELAERIFISDDRIDPRGWVNWIVILALVAIAFAGSEAERYTVENAAAILTDYNVRDLGI